MKKGIIVLLITVLVAGFAFASFSGSASIGFDFNLGSKENGLFNDKAMKYSFTFDLEKAVGESVGEGDLYAEIAATADFVIKANNLKATGEVAPKATLTITKANIIYKDFTINILGPAGAYDYAKSYYGDATGKAVVDFANGYKAGAPGFVASYKDYSLAFAYRTTVSDGTAKVDAVYGWKDDDKNPATAPVWGVVTAEKAAVAPGKNTALYAGLQTPAYELADGLTLQVAGNFKMTKENDDDADLRAGGGAKVAYKNEDAKLSASFAADAEYNDKKLPIDVSASATYDFVTANIYFGTSDKFAEDSNLLSAKLSASKTFDAFTVGGYAEARNIIKEDRPWILFGVDVDYAAEKFEVYCGANASLVNDAVKDAYKLGAQKDKNGAEYYGLGVYAGISTDAIISNCTLALDWTDADFSVKDADDKLTQLGVIAASATIAF